MRARFARARHVLYASTNSQLDSARRTRALPLLNTSVLPTAFCHMVALSFVGIPAHQSFRNAGFRCTTVQSGTISRSQWWMDSSIFFSRANRRSCNALRLFSSVNQCTGKTVNRLSQ